MATRSLEQLVAQIKSPTLEAIGHSLAGATAGAFALCILYPLDQIKVRKAVQSQSRILTVGTIFDDFRYGRIENILDIYRGLSFGILEQFSFNGVYFFFYSLLESDWKRRYSTPSQQKMPWLTALIRGSMAGLLTQLFTTPLKVIQLRLQTAATKEDAKLSTVISKIIDTHGPTGFWSGMKASVILVVNPALVQFIYGKIRAYLVEKLGYQSSLIDFFAGALSKACATVICYPLVLIKMNMQAGHGVDTGSPTPSPRSPMPLNRSNPTRFKYKDYQNGISDIKEEEEGVDDRDDEDEDKTMDTEDKYDVDIEDVDDNDSDDGKNGLIKDRFKKQVKFYHGNKSPRSPGTPGKNINGSRTSMTDIFSSTIAEKGIFGLYAGLGPKIIHASLSNAIVFASKEKFVLYTFAMMIYLQSKMGDKKLQKMTKNVAT